MQTYLPHQVMSRHVYHSSPAANVLQASNVAMMCASGTVHCVEWQCRGLPLGAGWYHESNKWSGR